MSLTHSEKALLLEALDNLHIRYFDVGELGKRLDKKNLINKIKSIKSEPPKQ